MTYARITKLACGLLAAIALTACGGGGDKGPAWAPATKQALQTDPNAPAASRIFSPGTYVGECSYVSTLPYSEALNLGSGEIVSYRFEESASGTKMYEVRTIYSTDDCTDDGGDVLVQMSLPVASVTRAGKTLLTGLDLAGPNDFVVVAQNLVGERIFIEQPGGLLSIQLSNGAVYAADEVDQDSGLTRKVIKDANGIVIFRLALEVDASVLKDSVTLQDGLLHRGFTDGVSDSGFDEAEYPLLVNYIDPLTKVK
jgi:hypothetical protein